jgi:hypothetical protein
MMPTSLHVAKHFNTGVAMTSSLMSRELMWLSSVWDKTDKL